MAKRSPPPPSYKLTTINDIFEKVPADRIATCCAEIGQLLVSMKVTHEGLIRAAKEVGVPVSEASKAVVLKFPFTWVDDGAGRIEAQLSARVKGNRRAQHVLSVVSRCP